MPAVPSNGLTIAYRDEGSGNPILFINGTGEPAASWSLQTRALSRRWRCVAIDNRDCGASTYVTESYTPTDMAADAAGVIESLDLGPCHVVGYSLGGATAQELALGWPQLVRSLVLLATWPATDGWFASQMRQWQGLRRAHWDDEQGFMEALGPWLYAPRTYATPGMVEEMIADAVAMEPAQHPDGWIRQCDADIAHDAAARLPGIAVPTLVLVGDDDICTPPRYSRALAAAIPGARLVAVADGAHAVAFERPDAVNEAIAGFLAGV